ncbi:hypothetical protein C8R46DRAFT_30338 [Mycena filopes]|nr:hypothetical protein C8R46DRAFT_30338 [Mycena filopes]
MRVGALVLHIPHVSHRPAAQWPAGAASRDRSRAATKFPQSVCHRGPRVKIRRRIPARRHCARAVALPSISPTDADSPLGLAGANFETTRSNYERARAFMDYYCRRFSYGEPDVAFTENSSGQWQAMMDVGGRRIGLGTSNNKHNAQVQCYLDVTAYLTSCDPELWKAYITESAAGSAPGGDSG